MVWAWVQWRAQEWKSDAAMTAQPSAPRLSDPQVTDDAEDAARPGHRLRAPGQIHVGLQSPHSVLRTVGVAGTLGSGK